MKASLVGVEKAPWWSKASVGMKMSSLIVPNDLVNQRNVPTAMFRLVPVSIAPGLEYGPFSFAARLYVRRIIESGLFTKQENELSFAVPGIAIPIDLNTSMHSTSHSNLEGGGVDINTKLDGQTYGETIVADWPMLTSSGFWLLGGKEPGQLSPKPPKDPLGLRAWVNENRARYLREIAAFSNNADAVKIWLPKSPILEIAKDIETRKDVRPFAFTPVKMAPPSGGIFGALSSAFGDQYAVQIRQLTKEELENYVVNISSENAVGSLGKADGGVLAALITGGVRGIEARPAKSHICLRIGDHKATPFCMEIGSWPHIEFEYEY